MIIKGSRYSSASETRNGTTTSVATPSEYTTNAYFTIVSEEGNTFQGLAGTYLNNPNLYWKLADLNKNVRYPDIIPTGTVIKIPLQ